MLNHTTTRQASTDTLPAEVEAMTTPALRKFRDSLETRYARCDRLEAGGIALQIEVAQAELARRAVAARIGW